MHYVHRYHTAQEYGGPEEGGWWYDQMWLDKTFDPEKFDTEDEAYARCRELHEEEYARRKEEEDYEYTSVLSNQCNFYTFDVSTSAYPPENIPEVRPHYE